MMNFYNQATRSSILFLVLRAMYFLTPGWTVTGGFNAILRPFITSNSITNPNQIISQIALELDGGFVLRNILGKVRLHSVLRIPSFNNVKQQIE